MAEESEGSGAGAQTSGAGVDPFGPAASEVGRGLAYAEHKNDAQKKYALAAGLDMSSADKAELVSHD